MYRGNKRSKLVGCVARVLEEFKVRTQRHPEAYVLGWSLPKSIPSTTEHHSLTVTARQNLVRHHSFRTCSGVETLHLRISSLRTPWTGKFFWGNLRNFALGKPSAWEACNLVLANPFYPLLTSVFQKLVSKSLPFQTTLYVLLLFGNFGPLKLSASENLLPSPEDCKNSPLQFCTFVFQYDLLRSLVSLKTLHFGTRFSGSASEALLEESGVWKPCTFEPWNLALNPAKYWGTLPSNNPWLGPSGDYRPPGHSCAFARCTASLQS